MLDMKLILNNLPSIIVILPLISGIIIAVSVKKKYAWHYSFFTIVTTLVCGLVIFYLTQNNFQINYEFGGWPAPKGIEYKIDKLSAIILTLTVTIATFAIIYSKKIIIKEISLNKIPIFYGLFLICVSGYIGITVTADLFNLYVFLEISSLASYGLIAIGNKKFSSYSAFEYLTFGIIAATFILLGIGFLYSTTGALNLYDIKNQLQNNEFHLINLAGISFIIIGILLKAAIFPLHIWLPNVYQNAPNSIIIFLSAIPTKIAIYVMIRIIITFYELEFFTKYIDKLNIILQILSFVAIILASLVAIFQEDIKRILAYSTIAQIGYIILSISLSNNEAFKVAVTLMINHSITKSSLFMCFGVLEHNTGTTNLKKLSSCLLNQPLMLIMITINLASLFGIPLTAGFISKWYLIKLILDVNLWFVIPIIIGSILSFIYIIKIFEAIAFNKNKLDEINKFTITKSMFLTCLAGTSLNLLLGINTYFNYQLTDNFFETIIR